MCFILIIKFIEYFKKYFYLELYIEVYKLMWIEQ